jgi:hypothetical protein
MDLPGARESINDIIQYCGEIVGLMVYHEFVRMMLPRVILVSYLATIFINLP